MKNFIIVIGVIIMIVAFTVAFGQGNTGVIVYEIKVNVHKTLPPDRQEMKEQIPEFRIHQDQLFFNGTESLYKPIEEDEEQEFNPGNGPVRMRLVRPTAEIYVNPEQFKEITLQDFMGKKYRIEDTLKITPWKFGSDTKTIQGHVCKQASRYDEARKQNITVWYADIIRPFVGPEHFNTLPGTVLGVDINDGERTITATRIEFRELKKNELKIPSGGTPISRDEFKKMMEEQMQRMRNNGGNMVIRD